MASGTVKSFSYSGASPLPVAEALLQVDSKITVCGTVVSQYHTLSYYSRDTLISALADCVCLAGYD